jgi:hypothetical protein
MARRGGLGWVVVPTYTMMGPVRRTFEAALPAGMVEDKKETPYPYYKLRGGPGKTEIEFRTADKPDLLRGPSLQAFLFDEAAQQQDEILVENGTVVRRCPAFDVLLGRILDTDGEGIITTTPKGRNWLYEEFVVRPGPTYGIAFGRTDENPTLNQEAVEHLRQRYSGAYGRQELDAEFVSGEGMFFAEWDRTLHTCKPFEIPQGWRWYGAMDEGYTAPFSFGLYANDPEGTLYRVAEVYGPGKTTAVKARDIATCIGGRKVHSIICDPSMWAKKSDGGEATSEVLQRELRKLMGRHTPPLVRGSNNRIEGWKRAREWLSSVEGADGKLRSRFRTFDTCQHFIRTVPALVTDDLHVEDVDTHGEDHVADEWRYLLMARPRPTVPSMSQPEPNTGAWFIKQLMKKQGKYIGETVRV